MAILGLCIASCAVLDWAEAAEDKPLMAAVEKGPEAHGNMEGPENPMEMRLIEVALEEQGYFREDVPLTYTEQDCLHTACEEFGVDYPLMLALIERETQFRNVAGDGGASVGYCQVQRRWWGGLMEEIGADDLTDPYDNFRTACAIISRLSEQYGNVEDALSAYNTGHAGKTEYATSVLAGAEKWRAAE